MPSRWSRDPQTWGAACAIALALAVAGCEGMFASSSEGDEGERRSQGQAGFALALGTVDATEVKLTITREDFFRVTSASPTDDGIFSALVLLPAATDYEVLLEAFKGSRQICTGRASFDVQVGRKTMIEVRLHCAATATPPALGSVGIDGELNMCPVLQAVVAMPTVAYVGRTVSLAAVAVDRDVLRYTWTASAGELRWAATANAKLECTAPGNVVVTVVASDGDLQCRTSNTATLVITCVALPPDTMDAGMHADDDGGAS